MAHPGHPRLLPADFNLALALIGEKERLGIDELKLMILVEMAGESLYASLSAAAPCEESAALLNQNGREERAHAHRLKRAIEILTGAPFEIPPLSENPYATPPPISELTLDLLKAFHAGELAGDANYQRHAEAEDNPQVAELLRQNGREEVLHGRRVSRVIEIFEATDT